MEVEFMVKGFKNPIESGYVGGFKLTTAILYQEDFFVIDDGMGELEVSEYATLSSPKLSVLIEEDTDEDKAGMIQEINSMRLDFFLPVPLNPGCVVDIFFPEQYSVETVKTMTTLNAFGSLKVHNETNGLLEVSVGENRLTIKNACERYIEDNKVATILIRQLK